MLLRASPLVLLVAIIFTQSVHALEATAHAAAHAEAPVAAPAAHEHEKPAGVSPEQALGWLKNGNLRYTTAKLRKDGQSSSDIHRLSAGQNPHTIVISCSDSRVPPEIIFDQKLGEIFTVRTAGQALDNNAIGSIEYAVSHLGAHLILVMGHTQCGAVKAALDTMGGKDAGTPALNALVKDIQPRLQSFKDKERSPGIENESWANIDGVAKDLVSRSELLRKNIESGNLKIQTALYRLETGSVAFEKSVEMRAPASTPAESAAPHGH